MPWRLASTPPFARGHLVLLKMVMAAIPIYYMLIFRMPAGVRRCLEKIMRSFFWRGPQPEETQGVALVVWKTLCRPPSQGGLGIRNLLPTNMTLMTKWVSWLMQPSDDLVCGAARRVQTPARLGDLANLDVLRLCFHVECEVVLHDSAKVLSPSAGEWGDFPILSR